MIYIRPTLFYFCPTLIYLRPTLINPRHILKNLCPILINLLPILIYLRPTLIYICPTLIYPGPTLIYLRLLIYLRPTCSIYLSYLDISPSYPFIYLRPTPAYLRSVLLYLCPTLTYNSVLYLEWSGDCDGLYGDLGSSHLAAYPNPEIFRFNFHSYSLIDIDWPGSFLLTVNFRICKYNFSCLFQLFLGA